RFFLISTHYRSPIDLGDFEPGRQDLPSGLVNVHKGYEAFVRFAERYQRVTGKSFYELAAPTRVKEGRSFRQPEFGDFLARFREHMDDDFNTGGGVGVLFELATALNRLADAGKLEEHAARDAGARADFDEGALLLKYLGQILGLFYQPPAAPSAGNDQIVSGLMQLLLDLRNDARKAKNFAVADQIRKRLAEIGVTLEDRPGGTGWRLG